MKKTISILLSLTMMLTAVFCVDLSALADDILKTASSADKNIDVNKLMFESLLKDRNWVIDSLVDGDFSNNPYTELCAGASEETFLEDVLSNYENDEAFKVLVNAMQEYENLDSYATTWTEKTLAALANGLGIINDDQLLDYVDNTVKTAASIKYEDIINAVLCEDYTSSWGSTLFEDNSSVEEYRQMGKILKNLSGYQKALKSNASLLEKGIFESAEDFADYTDDFLSAYEDSLYNVLINKLGAKPIGDSEALNKKIIGATAMAYVLLAEHHDPTTGEDSYLSELYNDLFAPGTKEILSGVGKGLKIGKAATEYAMLLETLVSQTDSTVQVMNRLNSNTSDEDLSKALNSYAKLVRDSGNTLVYSYDSIVDYVNKQGLVGKTVIKGAEKSFTNYLNMRSGYFDLDKMVMTNAISEQLISMGKCVQLAVWIADKATDIKETSEKIYVCKYIQKAINETKKTYDADYKAFCLKQSDENARKCLDDLEFLKKLRLFGEKQAYGSVTSQTDSVVGLLLGGGDLSNDIEKHYQGNVDMLLGCTLSPDGNVKISVEYGDVLTVMPYRLNNGNITVYGRLEKSDGKVIEFPEADYVLMSSLVLDGGTLNVNSSDSLGKVQIVIPVLEGYSKNVNVKGSELIVGGINGSSLTVNTAENGRIETIGDLTVDGELGFDKASVTVDGNCSVGYLRMQNAEDYLLVNGDFRYEWVSGYTDYLTAGTAEFKGNFSSEYYYATENHKTIFSGAGEQTVLDSYNTQFANLAIRNPKVKFADGYAANITLCEDSVAAKIATADELNTNGYNLNVSEDIDVIKLIATGDSQVTATNISAGSLNASENANVTITGDLVSERLEFNKANVTVDGNCSVGYLRMQNAEDYLLVNGDFRYEWVSGYTDYLTAGTAEFKGNFSSEYYYATENHKTIFSGAGEQTVLDSYNTQFANLVLENTSKKGVVFESPIIVTTLFNHNQNKFTLYDNGNGSSFPDYDGDGLKDNIDPYPLKAEHTHTYDSGKITKAATCTANGVKTYTCTVCGETKTETIKAIGHKAVTDKALAATCTKAGKTAGSHCSVCNTVITAQKAVPATGHSYDAGKVTKPATATTTGVKTYTCTICGATKTEVLPVTRLQTPTAKAVVNANGGFTISWNKISGADKYDVYYDNGTGYKLLRTVTGTSTTTGTAPYGKKYSYKVRAVNSKNSAVTSAFSTAVTATNTKKLQTPTLKATVNANGGFTISWNKISGADKYDVYYDNGTGYKLLRTVTGTSTTTGTAPYGKKYSYKVRAVNSKNSTITSAFSSAVTATNNKKLQTPTLKATVNANGSFKLSWNKVEGATRYGIYMLESNGKYKWIKSTSATSWTTGTAQYGKKYTYKVFAVNDNTSAKSAFSSAVSATNNKKLQSTTAKVTVNANGSFKISWNKVTGATKYGIYMKQSNGSYKWIKTVTGTSWTTGTAQYNKQYSYKVLVANNNKSAQTFSNVVNAKNTKKLQTPSLKVAVNKNGSFKLSWGKVTGATSYQIYMKQSNGTYKLIKTTTSTSFTTAVASKGKTYSYKVRAVTSKNKNATSNYSKVVGAKRK